MLLSVLLKCVENGHFTTDQVIHWIVEARSGAKTAPKLTGYALYKRERQKQPAMRALSGRERAKRLQSEWKRETDVARKTYEQRAKAAEALAPQDSGSESDIEITDDEDGPPAAAPEAATTTTRPPSPPPSDSD